MPDELEKPKQKQLPAGIKSFEMTFANSVIAPTLGIGLLSFIVQLAIKLPAGADWRVVAIESGIFTAFLFVLTLVVFLIQKRKVARVEAAPKANDLLPGIDIEKFSPSTIPIPPNYPVHPDFESTVRMLKFVSLLQITAFGGMLFITLFSRFPKLPDEGMLGLACMFLLVAPALYYIRRVFLFIEWNLRELTWNVSHSEVYEFELYSITQEVLGQHMVYSLNIKIGDTLKSFIVNPMRKSNDWFEKLKLDKNSWQKISCYVDLKTGEPVAVATQNGPVWLSSNEIFCLLPPKRGTKLTSIGRLIVPLNMDKGLKLIADKSSSTLSSSKYLGKWQGVYSYDHMPRVKNAFNIILNQGPNGELIGTYKCKILGPLYGKITVEGRTEGNELYMNIVYHTFPVKLIEKPELWAGVFDPKKKQVTGNIWKGSYTGIFVMTQDI